MKASLFAALLVLSLSTAASADVAIERAAPKNGATVHLLSLGTRGLALEGERHIAPKLSLAAGLALRAPARGDYSSRAITVSPEVRWWLTGDAPWADFASRAMIGAYLGARLDLGYLRVRDELDDRSLGSTLTVGESLTAGYRFLFWHRLEVTPSATLGLRHEFDRTGRLAPWTRGSLGFGLTVGALF